jgi:glucosamine kinase
MKLIADSGSTKTDWVLCDKDGNAKKNISTQGLNPYHKSSEEIKEILKKELVPHLKGIKITEVFFYGSGCSSKEKNSVVKKGIEQALGSIEIAIEHDLLGAARSLCQNEEGIVCILGTGSNSCHYNGKEIVENIPSLGYLIGDEGSGSHLGKSLLKAYFYNEIPENLKPSFSKKIKLSKDEFLKKLYFEPNPNVFLASFSEILKSESEDPFVQDLVLSCFMEFIDRHVMKYENYLNLPVHFTGSIAHHYQDELEFALNNMGLIRGKIIQKPIEGLLEYHR